MALLAGGVRFPAALRCCGPGLPRASSGLESRGVNHAAIRRPPLALGKLRLRLLMLRFPAQVWQAQPQRQQADNSAAIACLHRAGKLRAQFGQETWPSLRCSLAFFRPCNSGSGEERGPRAAHCLRRAGSKRGRLPPAASLNLYLTNHQHIVCLLVKYVLFFHRDCHIGFVVAVSGVPVLLFLLRVVSWLICFRVFMSRLSPGPPHGRAMARPPRARATMRPCFAATSALPC